MNNNIQNEGAQEFHYVRTGPALIIEIFLLLSTSEFFLALFYYFNFYQRAWWRHPVSFFGEIILVGLFIFTILLGYLGYQSHIRPQKVTAILNSLTKGVLFILILCFLMLVLTICLVPILKPEIFARTPFQAINKHQSLLCLIVLFLFQILFTLVSIKAKGFNELLLRFYRKYKKMIGKLLSSNFLHKVLCFGKWMEQHENFAASIIFTILITLFFVPTLIQGKLPLSTSYLYQFSPWASFRGQFNNDMIFNNVLSDDYDSGIPAFNFVFSEIKNGKFPFWIPYINGGVPYGILMFSSIFSLHGLSLLLAGMKWGSILYMCLKIYIAGISIYVYLRYRQFARSSAFLGSLVMMFSSHLIVNGMSEVPDAVIYAPAILYFAELFIWERKYWQFFCLVISVTVTLLSGFPSVIMYTLSLVVLYLAYRNLIEIQEQPLRLRIENLAIIYFSFLIGILLLTFTLLPTYEFFKAVNIGYRIGRGPTIFEWIKIGRLINPNICGNPVRGNWFCSSNYNESAIYVGLIPLMLIPFSFTNKKYKLSSRFFLASATLILLIVFGVGSLNRIVGSLPVFNANPNTRMIALLPLCFAFISATGIDNLTRITSKKGYWALIYFVLLGVITFWVFDNISLTSSGGALEMNYYFDQRFFTTLLFVCYSLIIMGILTFKNKVFTAVITTLFLFINFTERSFLLGGYQGSSYSGTFYPETPAIVFLESKMPKYERTVIIGRDFIPSFPLYYSINSLTGHAFADVAFKNNLELINPGIYGTNLHLTQPRFSPALIDLLSPLLDLYRVRYIVTSPSGAPIWSVSAADQREYNQTYILNVLNSFGQSVTITRSVYVDALEIRISTSVGGPIPVNLRISSEDNLLTDFNGRLIGQESGYYSINLPKLLLKQGQIVTFEVTPIKEYLPLNSILYTVDFDIYSGGSMIIDKKKVKGDMAFALLQYNSTIEQKYRLVHQGDLNIYENTSLSNELPVVNKYVYSSQDSCALVLSQIDPSSEAVVEDRNLLNIAGINVDSSAQIREYNANNVVIDANIQRTSMVILSDTYDKGWQATIDGKQTKIYRVNCAMRGVMVAQGKHVIKMNYVPPSFKTGLSISLLIFLCLSTTGVVIKTRTSIKHKL